jgi:EmrB/QacA subfamily drug resistance transporter
MPLSKTKDHMPTDHAAMATGRTQARPAGKHLGLALLVICGAQLMVVLDATIVNVAIPTIHQALRFSASNLEWLITGYSLTFGGLLLFGGRTGDLYGKRRMFMTGVAVFALSSLLAGLATGDLWLIIARAVQGAGGAIAAPTALSLIATTFPEGPARNRAMGVYAAMSGAGGAVGLLLGGLLTSYLSWRWIFFVNVPIAAVILLLAPRALSESQTTRGRLDVPGAVTVTGGMIALVYGLSNASSHSWGSAGTVIPLGLAGVLLACFILAEARSPEPLMPLRIFANRNRSASYAMMLCIAIGLFTMFFFLTQFLQNVLGFSPVKTGVGFLPMSGGILIAAALASRFVGKIGIRPFLTVGPSLGVIGLAWVSRVTVSSSYLDVLGPLVVIAVGLGFSFVPLTLTAVSGVKGHETGLASALLNTMQQVGGALGLAVLSTIAISAANSKAASLAGPRGQLTPRAIAVATTHGYSVAFLVAAAIALAGVVIGILALRTPRPAQAGTAEAGTQPA